MKSGRKALELAFSSGIAPFHQLWRSAADSAIPRSVGLSHALAWPLVVINNASATLRQGDLAAVLGIENSSMVRLVDQLCTAGLVERRQDPQDRRVNTLHLTQEGRDYAVLLEAEVSKFRARSLSAVTDEELKTCLRVFGSIRQSVERTGTPTPSIASKEPGDKLRGKAHATGKY